ncbi:MAG: ABC transporter permease [Candidatus Hydrogenedentes bacterium]|nr:ABC transporter permease [Candidatus Hydrogenedentota bacterium]
MSIMSIESTPSNAPADLPWAGRPGAAGYWNGFRAAVGHALQLMLRRQRLVLAFAIALFPVLLPLATVMFSSAQFAEGGNKIFVQLVEQLHIDALGPLLALFFATMLIGEEVEGQTMIYILTRPLPRSAWILGRYAAYVLIASVILAISILLTFAASTTLPNFGFNFTDVKLMLHYLAVAVVAVAVYGSFTMFLGAVVRWPIVIGVVVLYGWQRLATMVPGVVDFLTIKKYTNALLPVLATQRGNEAVQAILAGFQREEFLVGATKAVIILVLLTALFLGCTIATVRFREYAKGRAVGS